MAEERVRQEGTNQSTGGAGGLHNLRDSDMGGANGDAVDSTYSANAVRDVDFRNTFALQGTGTTFFYPYGKSQQQEY